MKIALILAGGIDPRFEMSVPKQFVNVYNRPIITYTMEAFQNHEDIDYIAIACLKGWEELITSYGKQFNITKLKWVIPGGMRGQDSSYNGIMELKDICSKDDMVIIHDAIRPFVSSEIITDSILTCDEHGMGVAAACSMDTIMRSSNGRTGEESISRYEVMKIQTPQTYEYGYVYDCHMKAIEQNIKGEVDTNSMISKLKETIYFSKGSDLNLKINTIEDVEMFKALLNYKYSLKEINKEIHKDMNKDIG